MIKILKEKYLPLDDIYKTIDLGNYSPSYMHYFLARLKYDSNQEMPFTKYLRSRKHNSYVLYQIIQSSDYDNDDSRGYFSNQQKLASMANYCLVKRNDVESLDALTKEERIKALQKNEYIEDVADSAILSDTTFWNDRKKMFMDKIKKIWLD